MSLLPFPWPDFFRMLWKIRSQSWPFGIEGTGKTIVGKNICMHSGCTCLHSNRCVGGLRCSLVSTVAIGVGALNMQHLWQQAAWHLDPETPSPFHYTITPFHQSALKFRLQFAAKFVKKPEKLGQRKNYDFRNCWWNKRGTGTNEMPKCDRPETVQKATVALEP